MYAVIDIETTGGKYNEEGITEIAIYKYDGNDVVDQFISLINPEREIQPFVVNLTGINNKMLKNAPKFYEIAKRIIEITEGCILVAHNAEFDYRILRLEFDRLGFSFEKKTICTVQLSKELIPNQDSYSLGKLTKSLGIPISNRHRASGDAFATVKLFKKLLDKDVNKKVVSEFIHTEKGINEFNYNQMMEHLPDTTGIYYMYNENGQIIYIGKSKNIKRRVRQHLSNTDAKSKKLQRQTSTVLFEETGSELLALLKENEEIKKHKPKFNRALKQSVFSYGLYNSIDIDNYINLKISRINSTKPLTAFKSFKSGKHYLAKMVNKYDLCMRLCGLEQTDKQCFNYHIDMCKGACIHVEPSDNYNERASLLIDYLSFDNKTFVLIDNGRAHDERSVILVKNGKYSGFGYIDLNYQLTNLNILENIITSCKNSFDAQHIIQSYLRTNKRIKLITFNDSLSNN